tara:strand:- start:5262 stop:5897 length:636 start_codon:yes stop_codon:yes gene_type:complete
MTLKIVGAGFGRTGTYSLKAGLEQLGFGPCHHMSNVINDPDQIARWSKAASGKPDLNRIFQGFSSAVDFPVAAFWQEAMADWPDARVILSYRDAEDWYESFSQTILPLVLDKASWPQKSRPWFEMLEMIIIGKALHGRTDREGILTAYRANEQAVRDLVRTGRALIFDAADGWSPLCSFLGADLPATAYPQTNARTDFFASVKSGTTAPAA